MGRQGNTVRSRGGRHYNRRKTQRGRGYTPPEDRLIKGRRVQEKLRGPIEIPIYEGNNGDYSSYKYTILEPGTLLQFRSRNPYGKGMIERRPMWLEYRRSEEEPSFLSGENIPYETWGRILVIFGSYINTIRTLKPLQILHLPVLYNTPEELNSIESIYEGYIKELCVKEKNKICADGYTLDFMFKPSAEWPPFSGYDPVEGKRELCILDPIEGINVEFVESKYQSLGPTRPSWPRAAAAVPTPL